jgi:hypothetical protein
MMTSPPAPDDRQRANGRLGPASGERRVNLASLWAQALERFRDAVQQTGDPATGPGERGKEEE